MRNRTGFTLIEMLVAVAIFAIIAAMASPMLTGWLRKSRLSADAGNLYDDLKWAQTQAIKTGSTDIVADENDDKIGRIVKQRVYFAVKASDNTYRVVRWQDENGDNIRDASEFTLLRQGQLTTAQFGLLASIDKKGCSNNAGAPANSIVNFSNCPQTDLLTGYSCTRFDGKGFLTEATQNPALYMTDGEGSFAVSINLAGIVKFCRWNGTSWVKGR